MSSREHLFLDPGHNEVEAAASALIEALGVTAGYSADGELGLGTTQLDDAVGHIGGLFGSNEFGFEHDGPDDPADAVDADFAIFDDSPLLWSLWSATEGNEDEQRRRARVVFDMIVAHLGWTAILTHDFEELVATYDPEHGVREFPPGTPADGTGRHFWGPAADE